MKFQRLNIILGWTTFAIAAFTYLSTIEPTASFWDCGEYIATAKGLQVGHPPGAPLFQMAGRVFTLFAGGDNTKASMMVNVMSGLCSAFTILFLFWSITAIGRKIVEPSGADPVDGKQYVVFGSAFVGALAYTFSDSFWFSAVEGEVYAMASFFTAIVFWAILKWEQQANEPHADRWLILIAYLVGLSIGVHLLSILVIPAVVFIFYFKKYTVTRWGFVACFFVAVGLVGVVQNVIIPGIVKLSASYELFFVNSVGMPFNSGTIIYFLLIISIIVVGLKFTHTESQNHFKIFMALLIVFSLISILNADGAMGKFIRLIVFGGGTALIYMVSKKHTVVMNNILLSLTVLIIGYSSFIMLVIRANAGTPINENAPKDAISLLSYLNREQYGESPLAYGQYYNARLIDYEDADPVYMRAPKDNTVTSLNQPVDGNPAVTKSKEGDAYIIADDRKGSKPKYDPKFSTIFPRMYSGQSNHESGYRDWGNIKHGEDYVVENGEYVLDDNRQKIPIKLSFAKNLRYFFSYQVNWMYWRYFLWNFSGRQNDVQGHGNVTDGNWITGITAFDEARLGVKGTPDSLKNNKANNAYYALPLILGILGLWFHFNRNSKDAFVVFMLFFFTGLAIVLFLNQTPYQPRERDYAYVGSFYAYAIWIGLGVMAIWDFLSKKMTGKAAAVTATAVCVLAVPVIMANSNWDDHNRSNRFTALHFAIDYLESCAPNAILFTNGDNDTFPLWYAQEVEGIRRDVRVCNLSLLNTDWYINQMKKKAYESDAVPFTIPEEKYLQSRREYIPYYNKGVKDFIPVDQLVNYMTSDDEAKQVQVQNGKWINYLPAKKMSLAVDSAQAVKSGTVPPELAGQIVKSVNWEISKSYVYKADMMLLDLIAHNNWSRPIYFAVTTGPESYLGLQDYFQLEGLAYRFVPIKSTEADQQMGNDTRVATDLMYDKVINKFKWGNMKGQGVYLDENILRMCTNLRIQMGTLANALITENKRDSAMKVLDLCMQEMPEENVPFDATIYGLIVSYFELKATDKAVDLTKRLFNVYEKDLLFYTKLDPKDQGNYGNDIGRAQQVLQRLAMMARGNKQDELAKDFEARMKVFGGMQ